MRVAWRCVCGVQARSRMSTKASARKAHMAAKKALDTRTPAKDESDDDGSGSEDGPGKKEKRRLANRKNAQLSRDRKKKFIETLMKENAELMVRSAQCVIGAQVVWHVGLTHVPVLVCVCVCVLHSPAQRRNSGRASGPYSGGGFGGDYRVRVQSGKDHALPT